MRRFLSLLCSFRRSSRLFSCVLLLGALSGLGVSRAQEGPPRAGGPFRTNDLVEVVRLDPTLKLDIRYATADNFTGKAVYPEARAFLQRPAALALLEAHRWLKRKGYGIVIHDAYRPWSITKLFWDITPPEKRQFVADPALGSLHNRGCSADVSLYELRSGRLVEMPSGYDEMTERAYVGYTGGTARQRELRDLLIQAMQRGGRFKVYSKEWWHFDYKDARRYAVLDVAFKDIKATR